MKDYTAKIILDSVHDARLTTMEVTYPRFVHAEMMTHRMFSRNSASSRAIPVAKMIEQVQNNPAYPVWWGKNQSGMQAPAELGDPELHYSKLAWNEACQNAVNSAREMVNYGAHKQLVNRLLEPFSWITVIITATDWANFFSLRCHPDAQPEIRHIAEKMKMVYESSIPQKLGIDDWHTPYAPSDECFIFWESTVEEIRKKVSVARCARVSYNTHDGIRDYNKDLELYERLIGGSGNGHWSPFEHVAKPSGDTEYYGNFRGWKQLRKFFPQENVQEQLYVTT